MKPTPDSIPSEPLRSAYGAVISHCLQSEAVREAIEKMRVSGQISAPELIEILSGRHDVEISARAWDELFAIVCNRSSQGDDMVVDVFLNTVFLFVWTKIYWIDPNQDELPEFLASLVSATLRSDDRDLAELVHRFIENLQSDRSTLEEAPPKEVAYFCWRDFYLSSQK